MEDGGTVAALYARIVPGRAVAPYPEILVGVRGHKEAVRCWHTEMLTSWHPLSGRDKARNYQYNRACNTL